MRIKDEPNVQEPSFIEAARRKQLVECAIEAIAELGFERASLAEVARRAGVSKGVVSYYFAGKDALIQQAVLHIYASGSDAMLAELRAEPGPAEALATYIRSNVAFMSSHRSYVQAIVEIASSWRRPDGRPHLDNDSQGEVIQALVGLFRWGQESGAFRPFSPTVMAITLRAAIDALASRIGSEPDFDAAAYAHELVELFARATSAGPAAAGSPGKEA